MKTLPAEILNLIRSDSIDEAFAWLLTFGLSTGQTLRYARYASDVVYDGQTYTAWPFDGDLKMGGKGHQIPTATLTIDDAVRTLRPYAIATKWFRDCTLATQWICVMRPELDYETNLISWYITAAAPQQESIVLTLGGTNILKLRFPPDTYWAWQCPFARGFKDDPRCGYTGTATTCNGTPEKCTALGNDANYGGFLGLDPGSARLTIPASLRGLL